MILTSQIFDTFDRCERRMAFERTHEALTISPLGLLYAAVEASLVADDPISGAHAAILGLTQRLDVNAGELSPASAVRHVLFMAEVIALALRRAAGQASKLDPVKIGDHDWASNLFVVRGEAHRLILASHLDDDSLRSFAHSWLTIGEMAALETPITLTTVIIGAQRGGRRHSAWAKGFQHPVQKRSLRFGRRKGLKSDGFTENWKEIWREQTDITADNWLDRMRMDEVMGDLIVSRRVNYNPDDERMKTARRDMLELSGQMVRARTDAPMRRSSCDEVGRGACPWQAKCYSPVDVPLEDLAHLYRPRETPLGEPAE